METPGQLSVEVNSLLKRTLSIAVIPQVVVFAKNAGTVRMVRFGSRSDLTCVQVRPIDTAAPAALVGRSTSISRLEGNRTGGAPRLWSGVEWRSLSWICSSSSSSRRGICRIVKIDVSGGRRSCSPFQSRRRNRVDRGHCLCSPF